MLIRERGIFQRFHIKGKEQVAKGLRKLTIFSLLFLYFSFLSRVNKGKSVSPFHVSGNFYYLSHVYGRFGFSYLWFGAFFSCDLFLSSLGIWCLFDLYDFFLFLMTEER